MIIVTKIIKDEENSVYAEFFNSMCVHKFSNDREIENAINEHDYSFLECLIGYYVEYDLNQKVSESDDEYIMRLVLNGYKPDYIFNFVRKKKWIEKIDSIIEFDTDKCVMRRKND